MPKQHERKRIEPIKTPKQRADFESLLIERGQLYFDVWRFGVNSALRISDIRALTMDDARSINPTTRILILRGKKANTSNELTLNINAMEVVYRRLQNHPMDTWLFQSTQYPKVKRKESEVPARREFGAISSRSVARVFSECGHRLSPRLTISTHSMRKTRGYVLYENGFHIEQISEVLNHNDYKVTRKYIGVNAERCAKSTNECLI